MMRLWCALALLAPLCSALAPGLRSAPRAPRAPRRAPPTAELFTELREGFRDVIPTVGAVTVALPLVATALRVTGLAGAAVSPFDISVKKQYPVYQPVLTVNASQWLKLVVALSLDFAGDASLGVPVLGELSDLVWAPVSFLAARALFSNAVAVANFAEEALPFTDVVPTNTLAWVVETFYADSELAARLGLGRRKDEA